MDHRAIALALALTGAACGAASQRVQVAPASAPRAERDTIAAEEPATKPASDTQSFANADVDYAFADPDRAKKIAAAFPAIDRMVEDVVHRSKTPGVAIGVVVDDQLMHGKGFGVTDLESKAPPDIDTVYRIGSITKSFTAFAVLSLRDEGVLSLDDPLTRWIPEAAGLVYPTRDAPPITLRQLLNHTSGLPRNAVIGTPHPTEADLMKALSNLPLETPPGTRFSYSNLGFGLLGVVAARAAHVPLRDVIGKRVLSPLGMNATVWDPENVTQGKLATPYAFDGAGEPHRTELETFGAVEGAGGEYSSVRDMARYVSLQLAAYPPRNAPEAGPLRRSTVREAHFQALASGMHVRVAETAAKNEPVVEVYSHRYGFGWTVEQNCEFDHIVWHNGLVQGYVSKIALLPEYGVGVIALANASGAGAYQADGIADQMLHLLKQRGGLSKRSPKLAAAFEPTMKQFLSVYNGWDEAQYRAMLRRGRPDAPDEKEELAGYKELHGSCTGYSVLEALTPYSARLKMDCERGSLEMAVTLFPEDGKIDGFIGTSRDVTAPPPVRKMADRLAGLVGKWDPNEYKKHVSKLRPIELSASFFAMVRASHGSCAVKSSLHEGLDWKMRLRCDRGGDSSLEVALDPKNTELAKRYAFHEAPSGEICPIR